MSQVVAERQSITGDLFIVHIVQSLFLFGGRKDDKETGCFIL